MAINRTNILVIDDQPDNLRVLSKILQSKGYRVRQATSGKTALKTASSEPPDLILLDIMMPEMDGYHVCAALKRSPLTRDIPIIFLSALGETSDKVKAFEMGGVDYITKPFDAGEVLVRITNQLTIRRQHHQLTTLLQEVQQLNTSLEHRVRVQTLELQKALEFEKTLKYISDRVRDSLDRRYILQAAVEEVTRVLEAQCCDTVLYNADQTAEIFCFNTRNAEFSQQDDSVSALLLLPGIRHQLDAGLTFAFCPWLDNAFTASSSECSGDCSAILCCPIWDDRHCLGTLWLFKPLFSSFGESEIRLVQQVANQCGIALRQARLYEAAQAQIVELHRLNQLKDDFLNTISHELRTPVASMRMVLQLLMAATEQGQTFLDQMTATESGNNRIVRYFQILQEECEREIGLIQDLLDLQQLDAGAMGLDLTTIELNSWLLHLLEPYQLEAETHHQEFTVQLEPNLPILTTDLRSLSRIVTELLNNACKYTPAHEQIAVFTETTPSHILMHIRNSGVDVAPEELTRMFDRFYRIPNRDPWKYSGTGLGLALARKLATHIGSEIQVTTHPRAICFTLRLPYQNPVGSTIQS